MSRRWATTGVFFVNGAVIGTFVAQIPWIQERFDFSKSAMGLVLVGMSLAVIVAFPIAGQAIVKRGSVRMTWLGSLADVVAVNLVVLAPHPLLVPVALFVLGASNATMDVSMNAHGVKVERDLGRPIMSSLHAGWSFGGVVGAGFAAGLAALGVDPRITVAIASALLLVTVLVCTPRIGEGSEAEGEEAPRFTLPSRGVLLLAILCLLVMVTEGAMADWSGIYLRGDLGSSAAVAALAFAVFSAGMTTGRVFGDWVTGRIGAVATLRWGALLTGIPLAALLLTGTQAAALIGLFAIGLGVANGVPLMFSAAGRQPNTPAGPGIAAVSSMGSFGFLVGPPFIGVLADAVSLPWALATLILGAVAVFALARRAAGQTQPEDDGPVTFTAVISDLDGVLIDSSAPTVRSWRAWGERHGLDGEAIQAGNHGRPARAVIAEHVAPAQLDEEAALLAHAETTDTDGVVAYPGACDVLALPRVAIATSCAAPLARARLAAAGLPVPDVLVTADQVEHGKPAPDPYLLAAERLGVDPAACVVLEDAPAGIAAGRAAGMTVWAVTTTHGIDALGGAARVAGGLPEHLAALQFD
jgi:beta-phosphoglucomutase-like phosphatase (HAD superfamily)/predicted MFS family arabinose efflux permease